MRNIGIFLLSLAVIIQLFLTVPTISAAPCPCDIYKAAGTPCAAAHSTVRALYESYKGPLYQVRRTSDNATKDIGVTPDGYANVATQDSFLNGKAGTISIIYDQSPNKNDLRKSPKALHLANGGNEANAADGKDTVNGHIVHGIYVSAYSTNVAYRNNACKGTAVNDEPEAEYMVVNGKRYSDQCCFDYGNAETSGNDDGNGTMEAIYFGTDITWGGKGDGNGPWVAGDLENGMFKGNGGGWQTKTTWPNAKSIIARYATAMLKGPSGNHFTLKAGDAQSGKLITMWDGARPSPGYVPMKKQGAIILGTGGDASNGGAGTWYEGVMTTGVPTDAIDDSIQANIVAAGYGSKTTRVVLKDNISKVGSLFDVHYNALAANATISYTLQNTQSVKMAIFNQQGRQIATIVNSIQSAGRHEVVWNARNYPCGIYFANMITNGHPGSTGRIIVGK